MAINFKIQLHDQQYYQPIFSLLTESQNSSWCPYARYHVTVETSEHIQTTCAPAIRKAVIHINAVIRVDNPIHVVIAAYMYALQFRAQNKRILLNCEKGQVKTFLETARA